MIRVLVVGAALALGACAPAVDTSGDAGLYEAVPAPTPEDVTVRINEEQDGQRIEVAVNQRFAVELIGVPTAGYEWAPAQVPAFLTRAGEASGNTTAAQGEPGFTGGNHWEVLMFAATEAGEGELLIEQRRPWETEEPATKSFRVTIVAR
jgi:predicted secreted protein